MSALIGLTSDSQTTITFSGDGEFSSFGGIVSIESEQIKYTEATDKQLLGCTRGYNGTSAAQHTNGKAIISLSVNESPVSPGMHTAGSLSFQNIHADLGSSAGATDITTVFTPTQSGLYLYHFYGLATVAPTGGDASPNLYLVWTDEHGTQKYFNFAGNLDQTYTDGPNSVTMPIYAKAGTPIWFYTAAGNYSSTVRWSFYFSVTQL